MSGSEALEQDRPYPHDYADQGSGYADDGHGYADQGQDDPRIESVSPASVEEPVGEGGSDEVVDLPGEMSSSDAVDQPAGEVVDGAEENTGNSSPMDALGEDKEEERMDTDEIPAAGVTASGATVGDEAPVGGGAVAEEASMYSEITEENETVPEENVGGAELGEGGAELGERGTGLCLKLMDIGRRRSKRTL